MKHHQKVLRPKGTLIVTVKGIRYVYVVAEKRYNKEKHYNENKRVCIGKMIDREHMQTNDNYQDFFKEETELQEAAASSDCIRIGTHMVIRKVLKELQLGDLVDGVFEDKAALIKDCAAYMIVNETNTMQYFPEYGYDHALFGENCTDSTVSRMFSELGDQDIETFLKAWNAMHAGKSRIYVSYDSTNMNTVAGRVEMAEYGYAKEDSEKPQVNVSLAYDQDNSIPLFYESYPGSIIDNTQCRQMAERAERYGYQNISFILDRGYFSKRNIQFLDEHQYGFLIMTKGNASFVSEAVEEVRMKLRLGVEQYIPEQEVNGITLKKKLFEDDRNRYFHIYYDDVRASLERRDLMKEFTRMDRELDKRQNAKLTEKQELHAYEKYYNLKFDQNGYFIKYQRKEKPIQRLMDDAGYFVIISSEEMSAEDALEKYRNRDSIEKLFRAEKSYLGGDSFRVYSDRAVDSKLLVSFIATIIRTEIFNRLKPLYQDDRKSYTVPAALHTLDRIMITRLPGEKYHLRYALTKSQAKILKEFHITQENCAAYGEGLGSEVSGN